MWISEGIICPRKAKNVQKKIVFSKIHTIGGAEGYQARAIPCFVSCWSPQHDPHTRDEKRFNYPLDLGEFMRWVGCWLYMVCWFGIYDRHD